MGPLAITRTGKKSFRSLKYYLGEKRKKLGDWKITVLKIFEMLDFFEFFNY